MPHSLSAFSRKRALWIIPILATLGTFVAAELLLSWILSGYKAGLQARLLSAPEQKEILRNENDNAFARTHYSFMMHPYLGFVGDYSLDKRYNRFGFFGLEPIRKRTPDRLVVAITGGSVAQLLYDSADLLIAAELKSRIPAFSQKDIEVISIAIGGFKQPQQLIALVYFLSLGGEFDIVINLDGFNELALPYSDNLPYRIATSFPRAWHFFGRKGLDSNNIRNANAILELQDQREQYRSFFSSRPLQNTLLSLMLWDVVDKANAAKRYSLEHRLRESLSRDNLPHQVTGPFTQFDSPRDSLLESVRVWREASAQMARISAANGIAYFHFLQPNQYFGDNKVFTEEEKRSALALEPNAYRTAAAAGYDLLLDAGGELREAAVNFTDLTSVFTNESRTVYIDTCCHLNTLGNTIVARHVVETIVDYYNSQRLSGPAVSPIP